MRRINGVRTHEKLKTNTGNYLLKLNTFQCSCNEKKKMKKYKFHFRGRLKNKKL